jgi:hypothetical protein
MNKVKVDADCINHLPKINNYLPFVCGGCIVIKECLSDAFIGECLIQISATGRTYRHIGINVARFNDVRAMAQGKQKQYKSIYRKTGSAPELRRKFKAWNTEAILRLAKFSIFYILT